VPPGLLEFLPGIIAGAAVAVMLLILWRQRVMAARIKERSLELERLSLELIRANRTRSEFLASISHELRTPLNAIVGFIELLQDGVYGSLNPRQALPVERIQASATHLRHLVDQVLDLAKMAAGRMEVHPEPVDVRSFVLDVLTEMESLAAERGLRVRLESSAAIPRVTADPVHLRQILVNLVGNAIKFTETGEIVLALRHVSAQPHGSGEASATRRWLAFQVRDSGIGIAPADQERIFHEFEQAAPGLRGDSPRRGTGLGLPISQRLAHLMGGRITLESEPGKGSVFTLWLPGGERI
jgi:signal transduction histidine kinase